MGDTAHGALTLECEIERMLVLSFFYENNQRFGEKKPKINWDKIQSCHYHEITDVFARNPYRNPPIFAINPATFAISDHMTFRSKQVNLKHPLCKRKPPVPVSHTLQLESSLEKRSLQKVILNFRFLIVLSSNWSYHVSSTLALDVISLYCLINRSQSVFHRH